MDKVNLRQSDLFGFVFIFIAHLEVELIHVVERTRDPQRQRSGFPVGDRHVSENWTCISSWVHYPKVFVAK